MDFKVSKKETRYQPSGAVDVLVTDVFDIYPKFDSEDPNILIDCELVEEDEEIMQGALLATIRQRGVDPIEPFRGVRWAQVLVGEIPGEALITDINIEAKRTSVYVSILFDTYENEEGETFLSYSIKVVK